MLNEIEQNFGGQKSLDLSSVKLSNDSANQEIPLTRSSIQALRLNAHFYPEIRSYIIEKTKKVGNNSFVFEYASDMVMHFFGKAVNNGANCLVFPAAEKDLFCDIVNDIVSKIKEKRCKCLNLDDEITLAQKSFPSCYRDAVTILKEFIKKNIVLNAENAETGALVNWSHEISFRVYKRRCANSHVYTIAKADRKIIENVLASVDANTNVPYINQECETFIFNDNLPASINRHFVDKYRKYTITPLINRQIALGQKENDVTITLPTGEELHFFKRRAANRQIYWALSKEDYAVFVNALIKKQAETKTKENEQLLLFKTALEENLLIVSHPSFLQAGIKVYRAAYSTFFNLVREEIARNADKNEITISLINGKEIHLYKYSQIHKIYRGNLGWAISLKDKDILMEYFENLKLLGKTREKNPRKVSVKKHRALVRKSHTKRRKTVKENLGDEPRETLPKSKNTGRLPKLRVTKTRQPREKVNGGKKVVDKNDSGTDELDFLSEVSFFDEMDFNSAQAGNGESFLQCENAYDAYENKRRLFINNCLMKGKLPIDIKSFRRFFGISQDEASWRVACLLEKFMQYSKNGQLQLCNKSLNFNIKIKLYTDKFGNQVPIIYGRKSLDSISYYFGDKSIAINQVDFNQYSSRDGRAERLGQFQDVKFCYDLKREILDLSVFDGIASLCPVSPYKLLVGSYTGTISVWEKIKERDSFREAESTKIDFPLGRIEQIDVLDNLSDKVIMVRYLDKIVFYSDDNKLISKGIFSEFTTASCIYKQTISETFFAALLNGGIAAYIINKAGEIIHKGDVVSHEPIKAFISVYNRGILVCYSSGKIVFFDPMIYDELDDATEVLDSENEIYLASEMFDGKFLLLHDNFQVCEYHFKPNNCELERINSFDIRMACVDSNKPIKLAYGPNGERRVYFSHVDNCDMLEITDKNLSASKVPVGT